MIVILDTGILTLLVLEAQASQEASDCQKWLDTLLAKGVNVFSSEICDYEVRRGLLFLDLKKGRTNGPRIKALEDLRQRIDFLPINRNVLLKAADFWAEAQSKGLPGDRKGIDADVLISAQWMLLQEDYPGQYIVIATKNSKHFQHSTEALNWNEIKA